MIKIQVKEKDVYGITKCYPVNQEAKVICQLLNQKTLTENNLKILSQITEIDRI
uniref:Uncharacterized protein n=1 Tax=viral metagenome TaxID=1070528 RepID=A0A6M3IQM9_9ZZZZ